MKKFKFCKEKIKTIGIGLAISSIIFSGATFATEPEFKANLSQDYIDWINDSSREGLMPKTYSTKVPDKVLEEYESNIPSLRKKLLVGSVSLENVSSIVNSPRYNLAEKYPLRIKHQGITNQCWAFSVISSMESNIAVTNNAKTLSEIPDFSERHMDYSTAKTFTDGINENAYDRDVGVGGLPIMGLSYLTNGTGAVLEEDMPFENNESKIPLASLDKEVDTIATGYKMLTGIFKVYDKNGNVKYTDGVVYVDGSRNYYTEEQVSNLRKIIKENIVKYGAITSMTAGKYEKYYNKTAEGVYSSYFCNDTDIERDHAVTIVGWDDNYSKENFNPNCRPHRDGAYIVLNSYGKENFDKGYIYISYEDVLIETDLSLVTSTEKKDFDEVYQNDFYGGLYSVGTSNSNQGYYGTKFKRDSKNEIEYLTDIGVTLSDYVDIEVYLNPNGASTQLTSLVKVGEARNLEPGYHKIDVTPTKLNAKDFAIIIKQTSSNGIFYFQIETAVEGTVFDKVKTSGESYYSMDGHTWENINGLSIRGIDMKNADVCIKAFTRNIEEPEEPKPEEPKPEEPKPEEPKPEEPKPEEPKPEEPKPEEPKPENKFESKEYKITTSNILKVKHQTKKKDFIKNITTNLELKLYTEDGKEVTNEDEIIKTGMKLKVSDGKEYIIAVRGDMSKDGLVDILDLSKLLAHYVGSKGFILTDSPLLAADLNLDGIVDIIDISQMVILYSKGI